MHHTSFARGRLGALAPAAVLLLALCLLAVGAQALVLPDPAATAALVVSGPGLYELDHDLAPSDPVGVFINGSDIVFDGMGHRIAGTGANGSIGVLVTGRFTATEGETSSNVTVRNLTVSGWDDGIHIADTSNTVVEGLVAEQNGVGLDITGSTGTPDHHIVRDSVFRGNTGDVLRGKGILILYPAMGVTVERCSVTGNSGGIYADLVHSGSTPNLLVDSVISGNAGDGLSSHSGSFAIVRNCTVRDNGGDGLEFEHGGAEIVGNHVENNGGTGINVGDRGGSNIHGNWITGNAVGVGDGGDWLSHVRNNYLNNTDNGFFRSNGDIGTLNYTKSVGPNIIGGPSLGGNYWALPNGTGFSQTHPDTDGDGFCDEPYPVTEDAVDYLPLALQNGTPTPTPTPTPVGPTPYKPLSIPGRIEAEDYDLGGESVAYHDTTPGNTGGAYRHDDVDIETVGGITNVGWIRDGEYLTYTVNVTQAGDYLVSARVASPNSGRAFALSIDGGERTWYYLPNTFSFERYQTIPLRQTLVTQDSTALGPELTTRPPPPPVTLTAGTHTLTLTFSRDGQNLDWIEFAPIAVPTPTPTGAPYTSLAVPGTIEAEDYDLGGEGVAYHDTTAGNSGGLYRHDDVDIAAIPGGYAVTDCADTEWLDYTVAITAPAAGGYPCPVEFWVASDGNDRSVVVRADGVFVRYVPVPNTGSLSAFRPVRTQLAIPAGTHSISLTFFGGSQALDRVVFREIRLEGLADAYPQPNFTTSVTSGPAPLAVRFTDTTSEFATGWHWTFGDGATSTDRDPVHVYDQPGAYNVTLSVEMEDHWGWDPATAGAVTSWCHYFNYPVQHKTAQVTVTDADIGAGHDLPGRIEAEDYDFGGEGVAYHDATPGNTGGAYRHDDVDIENTPGLATPNVGWIRDGEWLTYTVNVTTAGTYALTARTASPNSGRTIAVSVDGAGVGTISVPNTGSFEAYRDVTTPLVLTTTPRPQVTRATGAAPTLLLVAFEAGTHTLKLSFRGDGQNLDWFELAPITSPTPTPTPYKPLSIPGRIEAEDYDLGGESVAYHDSTPGNGGGAYRHDDVDIETSGGITNVGWIRNGEYLTYTAAVHASGTYLMRASVASPNSGRTITVSFDGPPLTTIAVPNTGSFSMFSTVSVPIAIPAGIHSLRLTFQGDGQNLDWFEVGGCCPTPPTTTTPTTPAPSGGASFVAVPTTAAHGSAVKFTVMPASGKAIGSAWWSFDAPAHLNTWNSRSTNPTFFYPSAGTFSPLVKITYTDGSTETVQRTGYIRAT